MSLRSWLLFCLTEGVLCFIPGPAVLLVVSTGLARGLEPGVAAMAGILFANAGYFVLTATGIAALLLASWQIFTVLKWAGAAYLVWMGARMLLAPGDGDVAAVDPAARAALRRHLSSGLVTQGANPKALLFFSAIVPQFVDPAAPLGPQMVILGASSLLIELGVLSLYLWVCERTRAIARPAVVRRLQRAGGALLIGAGAQLAVVRAL